MRTGWSVVAVVTVVLAGIGFAQTGAGRTVLRDAGLAGNPPNYTALSFADPAQTPSQAYSREVLLSAPFVIHDASPTARRYGWRVVESYSGHQRQLITGHTTVASGGSTTVEWQALASCVSSRVQIQVRLAAPHQSVSFWVGCVPGTAP